MLYRLSYQVTSVLLQNTGQYIIDFEKINPGFKKKLFFSTVLIEKVNAPREKEVERLVLQRRE